MTPAEGSTPRGRRPLFQREDGAALRFFLRPGPAKLELAPRILREGGRLCRVQEPGAVVLVPPGEPAPPGGVSTAFVTDCLARRERLPLERYRLPGPGPVLVPAPAGGASRGRAPFTEAEDRALVRHVAGRQRGAAPSVAGTALWKGLEQARVTAHPWQAMRDRYLRRLRGRAPPHGPSDGGPGDLQNKEAMDASQGEGHRQTAEGCIFQLANREFEDSEEDAENLGPAEDAVTQHNELKTFEGTTVPPHPATKVLDWLSHEDSSRHPCLGPSAAEVTLAMGDMKRFMEEFGLDLEAVAQAFLKNSGEVAAVACYLRTGQRPDGCPLWSRQDDVDLLKGDEDLRRRLVARYGAENVGKREAFRRS